MLPASGLRRTGLSVRFDAPLAKTTPQRTDSYVASGTRPPTRISSQQDEWPCLINLRQELDKSAYAHGDSHLRSVIHGFAGCLSIFEVWSDTSGAYRDLRHGFETSFEELELCCTQKQPEMTGAVKNLCMSIRHELSEIRDMHNRAERAREERERKAQEESDRQAQEERQIKTLKGRLQQANNEKLQQNLKDRLQKIQKAKEERAEGGEVQISEEENNEGKVLECWQRIQDRFQRVTLNISRCQLQNSNMAETDLVSKLPLPVKLARYNARKGSKRGPCTGSTRVGVLNRLSELVEDNSSPVCWINGMAGTGKTTVAYSLCDKLDATNHLGASFFCSRSLPICEDNSWIIPSIAYQLGIFSGPFRQELLGILQNNSSVQEYPLHRQFDELVARPLLEVKDTLPVCIVVVIDALDECKDKKSTGELLQILFTKTLELPIKFVISSRPELEIRGPMIEYGDQTTLEVVLHELHEQVVNRDIERYLLSSAKLGPLLDIWERRKPGRMKILVQEAGTLFADAAAITSYITYKLFPPYSRSPHIADVPELPPKLGDEYYHGVDEMYHLILQAALDGEHLNEMEKNDMLQVLYQTTRAQETLTIDTVSKNLDINNTDRVWAALRPFWSVLHISEGNKTVGTKYTSFPEYILNPLRSKKYCCDPHAYPKTMIYHCLRQFRNINPQVNICGLESSYTPDRKVANLEERKLSGISLEVARAAQDWGEHLYSCPMLILPDLLLDIEEFLSVRLLLWMEVMNLGGYTYKIPHVMQLAREWVESNNSNWGNLRSLVDDACRFTTSFALSTISDSTPHIYTSMLPFWPNSNPMASCYATRIHGTIGVEGTAIDQRECTLLASWRFDSPAMSPVYSPDGANIAVGIGHHILLLAASSGQFVLPPLKGHKDTVLSVQFSPDGTRIASGSIDSTIRIWNTKSGRNLLKTLYKHTSSVNSVAFSPDNIHVVSGSQDGMIYTWNFHSGEHILGPLTGHGAVTKVKYSPNGAWIFACTNKGIAMWSADDGRLLNMFLVPGNDFSFRSVDISPDGTRIASGCSNNQLFLWDVDSAQVVQGPLNLVDSAHSYDPFVSVSFSPDGSHLIASSPDRNIRLWEAQSDSSIHNILQGHTDNITSVSFSPNGAHVLSGSIDQTLRQWDARSILKKPEPLLGHAYSITSVVFSPDGKRIISSSTDGTVCTWNSKNGEMALPSLEGGHSSRITSTYSPNGAYMFTDSTEGLVLRDSQTGYVTVGPILPDPTIRSAVISSDGTHIILGSTGNTVQVLAANTGKTLLRFCPPITDQSKWVHMTSIASSPDGTHIAVGSMHYSFSIHDTRSGRLLAGPFDGYTNNHCALAFSPGGSRIVTGSFSRVEVRDTHSGEIILGPLEGHKGWVTSVEYSPDGAYIVSGSRDSSICVWDAQTGEPILGPVKWHTGAVMSVRFSPDGTRIVSGSDDKTIRVTNIRRDLEFLSNSSTPTGSDWELNEDGWVQDQEGKLLVWIPPDLRASLMWPRTELLISTKGWLRLNFADAHLGESWAKCYNPQRSSDDSGLEFRGESFLPIASNDESG
ncbi:unnamed protein product [Rhizoctonia solani]|uniref:Nephrocystin 3-like N-terminal domain-containing protein n=1 Tax=Rhizoctonia solani TaxID=456999 RepID=A0A8H3C0K9_9AGAM|nr:unnamed protein product [Rhizoctonia solani]